MRAQASTNSCGALLPVSALRVSGVVHRQRDDGAGLLVAEEGLHGRISSLAGIRRAAHEVERAWRAESSSARPTMRFQCASAAEVGAPFVQAPGVELQVELGGDADGAVHRVRHRRDQRPRLRWCAPWRAPRAAGAGSGPSPATADLGRHARGGDVLGHHARAGAGSPGTCRSSLPNWTRSLAKATRQLAGRAAIAPASSAAASAAPASAPGDRRRAGDRHRPAARASAGRRAGCRARRSRVRSAPRGRQHAPAVAERRRRPQSATRPYGVAGASDRAVGTRRCVCAAMAIDASAALRSRRAPAARARASSAPAAAAARADRRRRRAETHRRGAARRRRPTRAPACRGSPTSPSKARPAAPPARAAALDRAHGRPACRRRRAGARTASANMAFAVVAHRSPRPRAIRPRRTSRVPPRSEKVGANWVR